MDDGGGGGDHLADTRRAESAAGHINCRFRSNQKAETLSTMTLGLEWLKELISRVPDVPNGLIDLQAWRVVVGAEEESEWWACDADV